MRDRDFRDYAGRAEEREQQFGSEAEAQKASGAEGTAAREAGPATRAAAASRDGMEERRSRRYPGEGYGGYGPGGYGGGPYGGTQFYGSSQYSGQGYPYQGGYGGASQAGILTLRDSSVTVSAYPVTIASPSTAGRANTARSTATRLSAAGNAARTAAGMAAGTPPGMIRGDAPGPNVNASGASSTGAGARVGTARAGPRASRTSSASAPRATGAQTNGYVMRSATGSPTTRASTPATSACEWKKAKCTLRARWRAAG